MELEFEDLETGHPPPYGLQYTWKGHESSGPFNPDLEVQKIWCVKFSPSGESIACVGKGILKVWDAAGGLKSDLASGEEIECSEVDWSKDGNLLVSGAEDRLKVWNFNTGRCVKVFEHETVFSAKFSPDDSVILSGSLYMAKIWNAETGDCINTLDYRNSVDYVNFNHDGTRFTLSSLPHVFLYDSRTLDVVQDFTRENAEIRYAKFFPVSSYMLFSMQDGSLSLYDMRNRRVAGIYKGKTDVSFATNFSFTTSGKYIISGSADNFIYIWKTSTQELAQVLGVRGHYDSVEAVDFNPDNSIIVSGSRGGLIKTWKSS